ncbi:hypothetical protein BFJ69_g15745 [Fusarium oxysporum]|uniref:Nephrocystin 3-like N-terminal domain-containing protein n=1 Tax=Fusarium oxysporum TaxID=5507 RepID=A0A420MDC4_FUSOX|nr:hypothetical protein BFJ69_g15745 [Fusarium oxysporum]
MNLALLHDRDDEDYPRPLKRQKTSYASAENGLLYDRYTIAWICALHFEMAAALAMMDEIHAMNFMANYRGDIVVGTRIMQYDFGRVLSGGEIQRTAIPKIPEYSLRTAVTNLRAKHEMYPSRVPAIFQERMQGRVNYHRPSAPDHLFQASYEHDPSTANCETCDQSQLEEREARKSREPKVHYGGIASSNQVMKDAITRDKLAQELEMEAAGLMDVLPCLPIRGICDYSDSHKAKDWQEYAAAVAAAYAREFLEDLPATVDASRDSWPNARPPEQADLDNRRQQLLESLEFDQIDSRKTTIKTAYSKTCRWFLKHPDYLEWLDSEKRSQHHGFLWIRGKPGAASRRLPRSSASSRRH